MGEAIPQLPATIGPFAISDVLGEGGMGVVYLAQHRATGERVALKTVRVAQETHLSGIRREIHALSRLAHPGVVRVLATGVERGLPWYAMELLVGTTLAEYNDTLWGHIHGLVETHMSGGSTGEAPTVAVLRRPRGQARDAGSIVARDEAGKVLPKPVVAGGKLGQVLTITRRLLSSLAFLHGEGIVHRDLKPQNVFLKGGDLPVLVDFGLAWRSAGTMGREVLDVTVDVVGTPSYMAPEQIRGDLVDARADLYAVGCLLYELLTSRPPFVGVSTGHVMEQHLSLPPAPPSDLVEDCPAEVDRLLLALLEKRPRDRIGHAEDVIYLLDELGAVPEPVSGRKPRSYVYRPMLAGREAALDDLMRSLKQARKGQGGCTLIAGESGIGKTYLALEVARSASEFQIVTGMCALVGTFHQGPGGLPLHPFSRLFQTMADRCVAKGREVTDRLLGPRGKILAAHEPSFAKLPGQDAYPDPPPLSGPAARDRLLAALAETLAALADEQPLLLLIDDLQWADELSIRFLTSLHDDWFRGKRIVVLATYRVEETTAAIGELLGRPYARQVRLAQLDEGTVRSLVCDMLAIEKPPESFIQFLARHSEGNPFFIAEYLRTATAEGLLRRGARKRLRIGPEGLEPANTGESLEALRLPLTMRELVSRRLDGLSGPAQKLAAYAGVMGREFDPDVLREAAGADDLEAMEGVAELVARQVFEPVDDVHGQGLRFVHDKLCEIAYERIDAATRQRVHRSVAEAIERRFAATLPRFYSILAHHYTAGEVEEKALEYLEKAGDRALAGAAYIEACDLYRRALALDDRRAASGAGSVGDRRRARWERRLGEATFNLGDLAACETHSIAALKLLGRSLPESRAGWAAITAQLLGRQALHRIGIGAGTKTSAEDREDLIEVAVAASIMAWRYFFVDDMVGVVSMSLLSVNEIEQASPPLRIASPYAWLGYTAGLTRLHPLARFYFAQAHAAAKETGDQPGEQFTSLMESLYHIGFSKWGEVERINRRALEELRDAGDPTNVEHHMTSLANMQFYVGRFRESVQGFEQILQSARARRNLQHVAWGLYAGCKGMIPLGLFEESMPRLREAKELLGQLSDNASLVICDGLFALAHLRRGEWDQARRSADETAARIERSRAVVYSTIVGYIATAETYLELLDRARRERLPQGDLLARARHAVAALRKFSFLFPFATAALRRYRGQLHALEGNKLRARRELVRAVEISRAERMPYDEAQALLLQARYFPARGRDGRLEDARRLFERLECAWHLEQVDKLRRG